MADAEPTPEATPSPEAAASDAAEAVVEGVAAEEEPGLAALLLPTLCLITSIYVLRDSKKRGKPLSWYYSLQFVDDWLGLTPEQYKGIGKYLKPWGKPPTRATFWVQILTTVVVIIISIGKAIESLRDPTFLTFLIVGLLFGLVLLLGYVKAKREQNRQIAEEEAADRAANPDKYREEEEEEEEDGEAEAARKQQEEQQRQRAIAQQRARAEAEAKRAAEAKKEAAAARAAEVAAQVSAVKLLMNKRVQIGGLASKPELNGTFGKTTKYFSDKGRFAVTVEGMPETEAEPLLIKAANLTPVDADGKPEPKGDEPPPLS